MLWHIKEHLQLPGFVLIFLILSAPVHSQEIQLESAVTQIVEAVDTPAQRSGVLESVLVREGQSVKKGERLGKILDDGTRLKYDRARYEYAIADQLSKDDTLVKYASKSLEVTRAELKRSENANQSVELAVSDSELDHLRLVVSKSELEVEKSLIEYEVAKLNGRLREVDLKETKFELSKHEITSPIDGQVTVVNKRTGEWIETGQTVFRIVRIDRLRVEGWVGVEQAAQIQIGQTADVTIEIPNRDSIEKQGEVTFVSLETNPVDRKIRVWVEIENQNRSLRPGLRSKVIINSSN
jgi:multidrug resistance efflux pump